MADKEEVDSPGFRYTASKNPFTLICSSAYPTN